MASHKIRPATKDDIRALYGRDLPYAVRAWAVEVDGELAGIGGIQFAGPVALAFSDRAEGKTFSKRLVYRVACELMMLIKGTGKTVYAVCDSRHPNAQRFLRKLGFRFHSRQLQGEVFVYG